MVLVVGLHVKAVPISASEKHVSQEPSAIHETLYTTHAHVNIYPNLISRA